jgi:hypothetical protein
MGAVPADVSAPPQGTVPLALDGPDVPTTQQPPSTDDGKTTPGTPVPGKTISLRVPNLNPEKTAFTNALTIAPLLYALRSDGLVYLIDADPYPSKEADTKAQREYLRTKGVGGEIIRGSFELERIDGSGSTTLAEGDLAQIDTAATRLVFHADFFSPDEDKKWLAQEKADLEKKIKQNQGAETKSKCQPIAAGESGKQIEGRFPQANNPYLSWGGAIEMFSKLGCDLVIEKTVKGKPSAAHAYVKDVLRTDAKTNTIFLSLAQPGSHDFVFTVRESPGLVNSQAEKAKLPIGTDGLLTVSQKQLNMVTVQVIERASGRLVAGIPVTFIGPKGDYVTETTNGDGEYTFVSKVTHEGPFRLSAEFGDMEGYRTIRASDRGGKPYTSMAGRRMKRATTGLYGSTGTDLSLAQSLPIVPANLGTGAVGEVTSVPTVQQATVTTVDGAGRQFTGSYNTVALPDNSSVLVGAGPGLIAAADPTKTGSGRRAARLGLPNPLDFLGAIIAPLRNSIDQGVANIRGALSFANQQAIAATANLIGQAGGNLISDKGLGVISTGGGNLIGQAGGNLISDKGLGVISVGGGNLIGQAGGNLIGQAGGNVISTGGGNLLAVHGGRVISTGGGN